MLIAVLADIHGNYPALQAVLADMPEVAEVWVLGDVIGELPYPRETLDAILALSERLPVRCILGNREESLLEAHRGMHARWWQGTRLRALAWTADQLLPRHWDWLEGLRPTLILDTLPGRAILFHGSPAAVRGKILSPADAEQAARGTREHWLLGGHTHRARIYRGDAHAYIGAGSVGISLDGIGGMACYALIDTEKAEKGLPAESIRHVAYDMDAVIRTLHTTGLMSLAPGFMRAIILELQTGREHAEELLSFARAHAEKITGSKVADIPPALWAEAEMAWPGNEWLPGRVR